MTIPRDDTIPPTVLVSAGLDRVSETIHAVLRSNSSGSDIPAEVRIARALRVSQLYARRARWWAVLVRSACRDRTVHSVYVWAASRAQGADEEESRAWNQLAERWTTTALGHAGGETS